MISRRYLAPLVAMAAGLAACGSDVTSVDSVTTTVAAPSSTTTTITTDSGGPADMTTVPAPPVADVVLAAELPQLEGPATIWGWPVGTGVTTDEVAALADVLGVAGSVAEQPPAEGGGYTVGSTERRLWVSGDGQATWSFMDTAGEVCATDPVHTTAPAVDSPADVPCTPARGVPSAEVSESIARDLLVALGVDPDDYSFAATAQNDNVWIEAALVVDGIPTQVTTTFAVGDGAEVTYASGQLRPPQQVGETTLIGTEAAFARLQSDFLLRAYSPIPGSQDPTRSARPASTVATEPVVITIVAVEPDWWTSWSEDGTVTLYPAYAFVSDQDERLTIPAVPEDQLPPELMSEPAAAPETGREPAVEPAPGG